MGEGLKGHRALEEGFGKGLKGHRGLERKACYKLLQDETPTVKNLKTGLINLHGRSRHVWA